MTNLSGMDRCQKDMTERILKLALEIIYLLTGEDYAARKKATVECMTSNSPPYGSVVRSESPSTEFPSNLLIIERNNDEKILDLTNRIIELLTGEVPIRCQDVTVHFSMEEWEYLEEHKELYKDVIMMDHQPLTSPGKGTMSWNLE
ncbi:hypothetical protein GDO78_021698 [Eleutherodactylus coqui]|uniref:KRAB domain-containing protein n=1 Tax=Eleutherodactylus coqui TaxID=57060 RepID=A0A8J6JSL6_ELECQ|nr:hypothetical protein GDO78_021698 [Eleutherodactylus coqui]